MIINASCPPNSALIICSGLVIKDVGVHSFNMSSIQCLENAFFLFIFSLIINLNHLGHKVMKKNTIMQKI